MKSSTTAYSTKMSC